MNAKIWLRRIIVALILQLGLGVLALLWGWHADVFAYIPVIAAVVMFAGFVLEHVDFGQQISTSLLYTWWPPDKAAKLAKEWEVQAEQNIHTAAIFILIFVTIAVLTALIAAVESVFVYVLLAAFVMAALFIIDWGLGQKESS